MNETLHNRKIEYAEHCVSDNSCDPDTSELSDDQSIDICDRSVWTYSVELEEKRTRAVIFFYPWPLWHNMVQSGITERDQRIIIYNKY